MSQSPDSQRENAPKVLKIGISHYSDASFAAVFQSDLATCTNEVIILSPFVSTRAREYFPLFSSLVANRVTVEVYTKPLREQPPNLEKHFFTVESVLGQSGVRFFVRPGMHEKAAILDKRILWHGSLNILSHNDTRESMLRFDSAELTEQVLTDLQLVRQISGHELIRVPQLDTHFVDTEFAVEAPNCPQCGGTMVPFEKAGLWLCHESPVCAGSLPLGIAEPALSAVVGAVGLNRQAEIACPVCGSTMNINRGVFLRVVCESEQCGFALDPRIASSLLRVLKRKGVT